MVTQDNKYEYLMSLKSDSITMSDIFKLFNRKVVTDQKTGEPYQQPPLYFATDEINIKKGQLENIKEDITTTAGRYIFNLVTTNYAFKEKIDYVNNTLNGKGFSKLHDHLCDELLMGRISGEEMGKFHNRLVWLNNFAEIFVPSTSIDLMILPEEIKAELKRLIAENKEAIEKNDTTVYINNVEKPILAFARKWYIDHKDPSWSLYACGGKPSFGNTFKNMYLAVGSILDITTGKYKISTNSFSEGIDPKENSLLANQGIFGAYNRAVQTQYGGAKTKQFAVAFQSQCVIEDDCGTNKTIGVDVTDKNLEIIKWRWIKDEKNPGQYIAVTPDNLKSFIGKHVEFRSPMYCMSDNYCWKCVGELYRRMGLKNCGLASQKLTSTFLNKALKQFHDSQLKVGVIDWKNSIYKIKREAD